MSALDDKVADLTAKLTAAGLTITADSAINYGRQLTVSDGAAAVPVNIYSGKKGISIVVGGSAASPLKARLQALVTGADPDSIPAGAASLPQGDATVPPGFEGVQNFDNCWIGSDESGKGDFFGPLVAAAVRVDPAAAARLTAAGVRDSKTLTDVKARALAERIREICAGGYVELEITPVRYNTLYDQFRSEGKTLNHLLAWAHARVFEDLLAKAPCNFAIADKFADERYIINRLMTKGRQITLVQTPKAERNIAVAAASVLARDRFLSRMADLSARFGVTLPKGASAQVVAAARELVAKRGRPALAEVAKLHFKTSEQI
jgi:ribonuclease HIII